MAHSEARAVRMLGVRKKILDTAKKLFSEQGYKKTTIRQIVQESGITSGSIYNLFENKDAVFSAIVDDVMEVTVGLVENHFADQTPLYQYAAIMAVEWFAIEKDNVLRELYYEAYAEPVLFENVIRRHLDLEERFLQDVDCVGSCKVEENHARMILSKGAMLSYIESFFFDKQLEGRLLRRELAMVTFGGLGIKKKEIKDIVRFMESIEEQCTEMADQILAVAE